jgi:hypothetical protein
LPKPPMSETITIFSPILDGNGDPTKDDFGRFQYTSRTATARVSYTAKTVRNRDGHEKQATLEIDLPSAEEISYGCKIEWTNRFGELVKGTVLTIKETLNYSGAKVYFRTVHVG